MKWLFLFVVLLNAAFLSWHSFVQDQPEQNRESVYGPPVSEKIHLLSEAPAVTEEDYNAGVMSNDDLVDALNKVVEKSAKAKETFLCPRMEIEHQSSLKEIEAGLAEMGWSYDDNDITGKRPKFWLYIAAPETPEKARDIVKDLAGKSIDSFVINRAEMKNRISLGLYSSQARAEQASQRIEKLTGYSVDTYEHLRNVPLHQIDIQQPVRPADWQVFLSRFDLSKMMIKIEKNPC
ncbi:SPOR domain-containing protein [Marinomonas sp. TW1]|uniref:SPOR domain-containing protein n=1 Tax=Marinomonas sp. TW1 TaxID=1561203 RepID=UPI0007AF7818|nr:SPOR domain-containing protein [Marinomonas sp. TW1]KZN12497.1 sporulation protein [Marinomonas sp. TW1]